MTRAARKYSVLLHLALTGKNNYKCAMGLSVKVCYLVGLPIPCVNLLVVL